MLTVPFESNGHRVSNDDKGRTVQVLSLQVGEETHLHLDRSRMSYSCWQCGAFIDPEVTAEVVRVKTTCPVPADGITSVILLEVPSGKIVVDDDMRPMFSGFDHDGFASYNSVLGQHQVIEAFAEDGCAFGPVGNSCPGLWKVGEDAYQIARMPYGDDEDAEDFDEPRPVPADAQRLAGICTDLWAYSIVDFDEWVRRGGDPEDMPNIAEIVEIPAGTYEFTHHSGELGFDGDDDHVVYADIRKVA
jgi:hypothetical protein